MAMNTGKIQGKHREFNLNLNVATLLCVGRGSRILLCELENNDGSITASEL